MMRQNNHFLEKDFTKIFGSCSEVDGNYTWTKFLSDVKYEMFLFSCFGFAYIVI